MNDKNKDRGVFDWEIDTNEEILKNDGQDYQTDKAASTNHGKSGSTEPTAIYADDKSKRERDSN